MELTNDAARALHAAVEVELAISAKRNNSLNVLLRHADTFLCPTVHDAMEPGADGAVLYVAVAKDQVPAFHAGFNAGLYAGTCSAARCAQKLQQSTATFAGQDDGVAAVGCLDGACAWSLKLRSAGGRWTAGGQWWAVPGSGGVHTVWFCGCYPVRWRVASEVRR